MSTWDAVYLHVPDSKGKDTVLRAWPKGGKSQGLLNVFHLPFMWKHRQVSSVCSKRDASHVHPHPFSLACLCVQSPRIVRAFHQLWCAMSDEYRHEHAPREEAASAAAAAAAAPGAPVGNDSERGLFCSVDRLGVMPPKRVFGTDTLFLHWDQNALTAPAFRGVQGSLNLADNVPATVRVSASEQLSQCVGSSTGESGGFWCVPASHAYFPRFGQRFPQRCTGGFTSVPSKPQHWLYRHLHKITMRAGSLVRHRALIGHAPVVLGVVHETHACCLCVALCR
jgi:hypothetical protein